MFTLFNIKVGIDFLLLCFICSVPPILVAILIFALQLEFALLRFDLCDLGTVLYFFTLSFLFPSILLSSLDAVVLLVLRFDLALNQTLIRALAVLRPGARSHNSLLVLHIELMLMLISPCPCSCSCQRRNRRALIHSLASVHSGAALTLARQWFDGRCRMG